MRLKSEFTLLALLLLGSANSLAQCQSYPFLKKGFNITKYQQCQAFIQHCPKQGPVLDVTCVNQVLQNNALCTQLKFLSDALHADPSALSVERQGNLSLVEQTFVADGQHHYYILSPQACMVDLNSNPFNLNPSLKEQYQHIQVVFVNWIKPTVKRQTDGTQSVTSLLKVTKNCLSCEILGWAKVRFDFTKYGKLISTRLVSFTRGPSNTP